MGGLISRPAGQDPAGQDIEMGSLGASRNGPQTAAEAQHSQAFEQHLGANNGGNGRRSNVYGPTGPHQVASNNAALIVHHNAGPFSVEENASLLEARGNHDAFTLRHNALSSRLSRRTTTAAWTSAATTATSPR